MNGFECLVMLIVVAAVAAVAWYNRARSHDVSQAFSTVARWYRGSYRRGRWGQPPTLHIPASQGNLLITLSTTNSGNVCTEATLPWAGSDSWVCVRSASFAPTAHRRTISLGAPEFEQLFSCESDDPALARQIVSGGVQTVIERMARIRGGRIRVFFGVGSLIVQKLGVLNETSELSAFVRNVLDLYDQAMLTRGTGIEFIEQVEIQSLEDAHCPVCGDAITNSLVFCIRCRTPHHFDCWTYCGKCSTYACGETQFVRPRVAKPR